MIDTLKLGIPLSQSQFTKLQKLVMQEDRWQWVQFQPITGELKFVRYRGLASTDQASFHREIFWDIPQTYVPPLPKRDLHGEPIDVCQTYLTLELSVPKYYYGHNIRLLYSFSDALNDLRKLLEKRLHCKFPHPLSWQVWRVDICYAWQFPSQLIAKQFLDSLKRIHYPRKKPIIYSDSILFSGTTYSLKFYLKYPEFRNHDLKVLIAAKANLNWVEHLEKMAEGVLRCEATLRRKYLKKQGILTVADLARPTLFYELDQELISNSDEDIETAIGCIQAYHGELFGELSPSELLYELEDGKYFTVPEDAGIKYLSGDEILPYIHKGGGFFVRKRDNPTAILQYFIEKFLGENRGMDTADQVKAKLLAKYKSAKALRLLGFWMHVQKFGSEDAKNLYGKTPYYDAKRALKIAEVSLVEPPKLVLVDKDFLQSFRLDVPSPHVVNRFDDFRLSENLLNRDTKFFPQDAN